MIVELLAFIPAGITGPQAAVVCACLACATILCCSVFERVTRR